MANVQKLKLFYIMDYLMNETDENHPVTLRQILACLAEHGIEAERKSIYSDIDALKLYGLDIVQSGSGRSAAYFIGQREFELPELKLLVDSVQSSKFITRRKSDALIKKIEKLAGRHQAQRLQRQVYVKNRIKNMNESIYYNVDEIHSGISLNRQIKFRYFSYTVTKKKEYRHEGAYYHVSPFALTWDDENYYMVAYDTADSRIKHFRVDKMDRITVTADERDGLEQFRALDMGEYSKSVFGMFSGETESVTMRFSAELVGVVLDRFGLETMLFPDGDAYFTFTADVVPSPQFFAWVSGFGSGAKILSPESVVSKMREHAEAVAALYM